MEQHPGVVARFFMVLLPTPLQAVLAVVIGAVVVAAAQSQLLLARIGVIPEAVSQAQGEFHNHIVGVLNSPIVSNLTLIVFWASIGLVAYLISWGFYSAVMETRNEVTLVKDYANQGHWRSPYHTLILKGICGLGFVAVLASFPAGMGLWLQLTTQAVTGDITWLNIGGGILGVLGLSIQLYALLAFLQLTLSPWYRAEL